MQHCNVTKQRQNGQACHRVRISVSDVQLCDGNAQVSSKGVNALMTFVTSIQQMLSHKVTISTFNKAASLCTLWSCDI